MNILCSSVSSQRADSIKIRASLREADRIGTPEAVSDALQPNTWRSVKASHVAARTRARQRSPEVSSTVAVMTDPDNLCLDILLCESELL